jgi:hypothetical protein
MLITDLCINQRFLTLASRREGKLVQVHGFSENPKETQYLVYWKDTEKVSEVHHHLPVEALYDAHA